MTATVEPVARTVELIAPAETITGPFVIFFAPTVKDVRRCIHCGLPITFEFERLSAIRDPHTGQTTHYAYRHPSEEACQRDKDRRLPDADPTDRGVIRARQFDALCNGRETA